MADEKLLPCPFCGGEGSLEYIHCYFWVECSACCATADGGSCETAATKYWNTRVQPVVQPAAEAPAPFQVKVTREALVAYLQSCIEDAIDSAEKCSKDAVLKRHCLHTAEDARFLSSHLADDVYTLDREDLKYLKIGV